MGVEFFPCDGRYCGTTICDCGGYVRCGSNCGRKWCDDDCARKDGFDYESRSCRYCRGEDLDDYALLRALLRHLGWTHQQAVAFCLSKEQSS